MSHVRVLFASVFALWLALASGACSDDGEAAVEERTALLSGLEQAGLRVSPLTSHDTSAFGAVSCERGQIEKLQLTLCAFGSASAAEKSAAPMEEVLAAEALTVVSHVRGRVVAVLADVDRVDPNGQAIVRVLAALGAQERSPAD